MQQKNIFLMLALSGSVLMMMLVSVLFFVPTPSSLSADITGDPLPRIHEYTLPQIPSQSPRDSEEILRTIQNYVRDNDPDTAKRLYNELYAQRYTTSPMGGEVERLVVR
jgi:hypothetical protein